MLTEQYRPTCFEECIGNYTMIASLKEKLSNPSRPHLYLFSGPKGSGKTTMARIFARALNCDIEEINTASKNRVEDARELVEHISFKPIGGGNRCFILDEAHRGTNDFQTILLKSFEEPPKHAYIILCSTEPEKFIPTVLSRACKLSTEKPSRKDMFDFIKNVCTKSNLTIPSTEILNKIWAVSGGDIRESLNIVEAIQGVEEDKQIGLISSYSAEEGTVKELVSLLRAKNWTAVSKLLPRMSGDVESIRRAVLGYCGAILLSDVGVYSILECFEKNFMDSGRAGLYMACYRVCYW